MWIPVKFPFEKLSLPNQIRAHSLMTQHCCRELTGGLSLCSMERITYESQTTARSCTLSRKRLGGPRTMCPLGASERVEKQCARLIRANVTARAASLRLCHKSSSRVETDALAHSPGVVRRPARVVRRPARVVRRPARVVRRPARVVRRPARVVRRPARVVRRPARVVRRPARVVRRPARVVRRPARVVRRPAGVAVVRNPLDPSPICRRLLGTCREADALSCSCSE